jgi:DNA-binding GntR family transcriptional regulator
MELGDPLQFASLADKAYERLDRAILTGQLAPGTLLKEAELAVQLGTSRGPVREALSRLEGRKLVRRVRQQGVIVVELTDDEVAEIMHLREVLEGLACRLGAVAMSDKQLAELSYCKPGAINDPTGDGDMHFMIAKSCGSKYLQDYLCNDLYYLWRLFRYRTGMQVTHSKEASLEHRAIVAAMQARNPELAETLMRQHIRNAIKALNLNLSGVSSLASEIVQSDANSAIKEGDTLVLRKATRQTQRRESGAKRSKKL